MWKSKINLDWYYCWSFPWRECEQCCIGLTALRQGDEYKFGIGFGIIEIGLKFGQL